MKDLKIYIIILSVFLFGMFAIAGYCIYGRTCDYSGSAKDPLDYTAVTSTTSTATTTTDAPYDALALRPKLATTTLPANCKMMEDPNGSTTLVPVCIDTITPLASGTLSSLDGMPIVNDRTNMPPPLLSSGRGTTTLDVSTPYNDILIAETGSEYATLRKARYTMWPYPGEVRFKEIYLVLPDYYNPIFPGYSTNQFVVSPDGTNQVMLYLRHKQNTGLGADAQVYVEAPVTTDETDHPLTALESSNSGAIYSIVAHGEEVLIEVTFKSANGLTVEQLNNAHAAVLRAVEKAEIVW